MGSEHAQTIPSRFIALLIGGCGFSRIHTEVRKVMDPY